VKNVLMYDKHSIGKPIIELNERSWGYDYYTSQSVVPNGRHRDSSLNPIRLTPFDYKGIKFNMITCLAGGVVDIKYWGSQKIKEPFMLGETEVTQELFEMVMGFNYSHYNYSNKNPVERVSWYDCLEFCNELSNYFGLGCCYMLRDKIFSNSYPLSINKAKPIFIEGMNGFRLPKEWEWQITAMAGTNNLYAGTNDNEQLKRVAWFDKNSGGETHPVAQKLPNEWGFYDMSGNVCEWCENSYELNECEDHSSHHAYRGGAANHRASNLCVAERYEEDPSVCYSSIGFRIARMI
jgi:hypothetical protein